MVFDVLGGMDRPMLTSTSCREPFCDVLCDALSDTVCDASRWDISCDDGVWGRARSAVLRDDASGGTCGDECVCGEVGGVA